MSADPMLSDALYSDDDFTDFVRLDAGPAEGPESPPNNIIEASIALLDEVQQMLDRMRGDLGMLAKAGPPPVPRHKLRRGDLQKAVIAALEREYPTPVSTQTIYEGVCAQNVFSSGPNPKHTVYLCLRRFASPEDGLVERQGRKWVLNKAMLLERREAER